MKRRIDTLIPRVLSRWFRNAKPATYRHPASLEERVKLRLETLEERAVPATFTVLNANDTGAGSFRQALTDSIASSAADTIVFDTAGVFATPQVITLASALPQITAAGGALTITGTGANNLTIQRDGAAGSFRVFDSTTTSLNMSGFTISGGSASGNGGGLQSIATNAKVNLTNMVFSNNTATGSGGACYISGTTSNVIATESVFDSNSADGGQGGAFYMASTTYLTLRYSTLSGNYAAGNGGGVYFFSGGSLFVEGSTISNNTADNSYYYGGGGIYFFGTANGAPPVGYQAGALVVRNSTIVDNFSAGSGGGIDLVVFTGTLLVQNSTITGNTADFSDPYYYYYAGGGGIARTSGSGTITVQNSVVSGNFNGTGPDILSPGTVNVNFSSIGDGTGFSFSGSSGNNRPLGEDPLLGALADNGGPTMTRAPLAGSPLLDNGSTALIPPNSPFDQRGFPRTYTTKVDIGAVEIQPGPFAKANTTNVSTAGATSYTFTVTYSDPLGTNNGMETSGIIGNNNAIRVTGPGGFNVAATYVSIDNLADGTPRTATYSITPPGGSWDGPDNGSYTVVMQASQVADIDGNFVQANPIGTFTVAAPFIFTVTNANDSGAGSFRDAIAQSVAAVGTNDTIIFSPLFNTPQTITLLTALPQITLAGGELTIIGPGSKNVNITRDVAAANFRILDSTTSVLNISGVTLSGGQVTGNGGAINVVATNSLLNLDGVEIIGNSASTSGGGIYFSSTSSFLMMKNSIVANNIATTNGGGIDFFNGGSFFIENSTISGNVANSTTVGGGGIYFWGTASATPPAGFVANNIVIRNSTINNNTAAGNGGGIRLQSFTGALQVQNSTLAANTTTGSGGGINHASGSGNILILNSTISGNSAAATAANTGGGGIGRISTTAGTILIQNSVVSGNTNANGPDILAVTGTTTTANFSAIGDKNGFTLSGASGNNLAFGTNLKLGALADNGGTSKTMIPLAGSPLIGAGSNALVPAVLTTDQRGSDFVRINGTAVDIGSVETQPIKVTINQSTTQGDPTNKSPITFTAKFASPVTGFTGSDISFAGSTIGGTPVANVIGTGAVYTVEVTGMSGEGTVVASIPAGSAQDAGGNLNLASTSTDNTVYYDNVQPTVTVEQAVGQVDPTNASPILFTVTFSEPVLGFTESDLDLTSSTVGGTLVPVISGSGPVYTVSVTGMNGTGSVIVNIPADAVNDPAGNKSKVSTSVDNSVIFDNVKPTVTINQKAGQPDPTTLDLIEFTVVFSEPVLNFTSADIDLTGTTTGGALQVNVSGSGANYTVSITGMVGDGIVKASIPAGVANDPATNTNEASTSVDNEVIFIDVPPSVTINQAAGQVDPTNTGPIFYTVTFSEAVTGFDGNDIDLSSSTVGGTLVATVSGSGAAYTVQVTGMSGVGDVIASIPSGKVLDANNQGNFPSTSTDNKVHFDNVASKVTINQAAGQSDPTNSSPITFTVVFDEPVTGLTSGDIDLSSSTVGGVLVANVSGSGANYTVTVTGMNGVGDVIAKIPALAVIDAAGNQSEASTSTDNKVYFDNVKPTVTINQAAGQADPTNKSPIQYTVVFSEAVTGFTGADIDFTGSTNTGTLVATVSGSGANYTVSVNGMIDLGTVVAKVKADGVIDIANNTNFVSTSTDNVVLFNDRLPEVTINQAARQLDPINKGPILFTVVFKTEVFGFTGSDVSFVGSTVGGALNAVVTGSGANYTVAVTGMTTTGDLIVSIPAGGCQDIFGNLNFASTSTDNKVRYDNEPPAVNAGLDAKVNESELFTGAGSFTDVGGTTWTANVNYGDGTGTVPLTLNANKTFNLSHTYADNGVYTVTVNVLDDVGRVGTDTRIVTVSNLAPESFVTGPFEGSRGFAQIFTFSASDPSPVDEDAGFTYFVQWGDGKSQTVSATAFNGLGTDVAHTYINTGNYTVSLTARDKDGAVSTVSTHDISIVPISVDIDVLKVGGSTKNDTILFSIVNGGIQVSVNNVKSGPFFGVAQIAANGVEGNDLIRVDAKIALPAILDGGPGTNQLYGGAGFDILYGGIGNDLMDGGAGDDILVGRGGNDNMKGGAGRDILIGGAGTDTLVGGAGENILIGGSTAYDSDQNSLLALLAEWSRTDLLYAERIANLDGTTPGGFNDPIFLNAGTVFNDSAVDSFFGDTSNQWYMMRVTGTSKDKITGKKKTEIATNI